MADETSAQAALTRLEQAFERIEAAADRLRQGDRLATLEARHRKLQAEVEVALSGLDRLLAPSETR